MITTWGCSFAARSIPARAVVSVPITEIIGSSSRRRTRLSTSSSWSSTRSTRIGAVSHVPGIASRSDGPEIRGCVLRRRGLHGLGVAVAVTVQPMSSRPRIPRRVAVATAANFECALSFIKMFWT